MNIDTPTAQLRAQVAKSKQFICADQNVNGVGAIGQGLDDVQLVRKPPAGTHSGQMLRFVNQYCHWTSKGKRPLHSVVVFGSDGPGARHEPHRFVPDMDGYRCVDLVVDQGFVHLKQKASKVIAPTEAARFRSDTFDADDGQTAAVGFEHGQQFRGDKLLDFRA